MSSYFMDGQMTYIPRLFSFQDNCWHEVFYLDVERSDFAFNEGINDFFGRCRPTKSAVLVQTVCGEMFKLDLDGITYTLAISCSDLPLERLELMGIVGEEDTNPVERCPLCIEIYKKLQLYQTPFVTNNMIKALSQGENDGR